MNTFGIDTGSNGYVDTSSTLAGAKNHATRHGYTTVYVRFSNGYHIAPISTKVNGKWVPA